MLLLDILRCHVFVVFPLAFLVFRGQGIKLTSYVAKKCREKIHLCPIWKNYEREGYEGAIVLPPKCLCIWIIQ